MFNFEWFPLRRPHAELFSSRRRYRSTMKTHLAHPPQATSKPRRRFLKKCSSGRESALTSFQNRRNNADPRRLLRDSGFCRGLRRGERKITPRFNAGNKCPKISFTFRQRRASAASISDTGVLILRPGHHDSWRTNKAGFRCWVPRELHRAALAEHA
jgi:hypothetical protein